MCNCTSEVWSFGPSRNDDLLIRASLRTNAAEIIRLAELHVIDAELRQRPTVAAFQQFDHQFMLARSPVQFLPVIPGRAKREPGIQGFPDVQLHI